ncbi:MAG: response regulator [Anaerotruncus sp.]|nr:response regulator [Anaerotruncus sp.]
MPVLRHPRPGPDAARRSSCCDRDGRAARRAGATAMTPARERAADRLRQPGPPGRRPGPGLRRGASSALALPGVDAWTRTTSSRVEDADAAAAPRRAWCSSDAGRARARAVLRSAARRAGARARASARHSVQPEAVLALARELFGARAGRPTLLGIRGYEFDEFGEALTARAARATWRRAARVPRARVLADARVRRRRRRRRRPPQSERGNAMKDGKHVILCVDDDPDILESLKVVLEANGYAMVDGAARAEEGCERYKAERPDLVIVDLMMEEVDAGAGFVKELKAPGQPRPRSTCSAPSATSSHRSIDSVAARPRRRLPEAHPGQGPARRAQGQAQGRDPPGPALDPLDLVQDAALGRVAHPLAALQARFSPRVDPDSGSR